MPPFLPKPILHLNIGGLLVLFTCSAHILWVGLRNRSRVEMHRNLSLFSDTILQRAFWYKAKKNKKSDKLKLCVVVSVKEDRSRKAFYCLNLVSFWVFLSYEKWISESLFRLIRFHLFLTFDIRLHWSGSERRQVLLNQTWLIISNWKYCNPFLIKNFFIYCEKILLIHKRA